MEHQPAFAQHLLDRRAYFNARVAAACARTPSFDRAAFAVFLETLASPLAQRDNPVLMDALFEAAITLTEHRWVGQGARAQLVTRLWSEVLPTFSPVIATHPKAAIAMLSNATINISQEPGVRIEQWLSIVASLGEKARKLDEARHLIVICTWRAGAAHVRDAALAAAAQLPPAVACAAVGHDSENDWNLIAQTFATHHWWAPDVALNTDGHRVGAFSGFGGYFSEPPQVFVSDDMFVVQSGGHRFTLHADAYGATLRPIDQQMVPDNLQQWQSDISRLSDGNLRADDRIVPFSMPSKGLQIAETSDSMNRPGFTGE